MKLHRRLAITGLVQGVGYRASFAAQARALGLSGWVRNRRDGSVDALVAGDAEAVGDIIDWAWQGPPGARVSSVSATDAEAAAAQDEALDGMFEIRPTE